MRDKVVVETLYNGVFDYASTIIYWPDGTPHATAAAQNQSFLTVDA